MNFKLRWGLAAVLVGAMASAGAERRKDAAEEVQEGSVANWMEYYKRERGLELPKETPSPSTPPEKPAVAPVK